MNDKELIQCLEDSKDEIQASITLSIKSLKAGNRMNSHEWLLEAVKIIDEIMDKFE